MPAAMTLLDCFLRGAMVGAGMLAFGGLCWALERQGRKRWNAEHRGYRVSVDGHIEPTQPWPRQ